jgi:hypothetical protein
VGCLSEACHKNTEPFVLPQQGLVRYKEQADTQMQKCERDTVPAMKRLFINLTCTAALLVTLSGCGESSATKTNREFSYHKVDRYDAPSHGIRLGNITVPGHTQEVTLFWEGIPTDSPEVAPFDDKDSPQIPYIFGEMNREPDLGMLVKDHPDINDNTAELSLIALAAFNNGAHLVILSKNKVYLATTDELDDLDGEVHRAGY